MLNITIVTNKNRYRFTATELRGYIASRNHSNRSVRWRITRGYAAIVPWCDVKFEITADGKLVKHVDLSDYWSSPLGLAKQMLEYLNEIQDRDLIEVHWIIPPDDEKEWREVVCYRALLAHIVLNLSCMDERGYVNLHRVRSRVNLVKVGRKWYRLADGEWYRGSDVYDLFRILDKNVCGRIADGMASGAVFEAGIANIVAEYCDFGRDWGPDPAGFREIVEGQIPVARVEWINSADADVGFVRAVPWWDE